MNPLGTIVTGEVTMPFECKAEGSGFVRIRLDPEFTAQDLYQLTGRIYDDYGPTRVARYQLWDMSRLPNVPGLTADMIAAIGRLDRQGAATLGHVTIAIASSRDLMYGLSRMYEAMVADPAVTTAVFREVREAEQWLLGQIAAEPAD